jgi:hypothetical protein
MRHVDVRQATHVQVQGRVEKIDAKWGIDAEGRLAKPPEGGFGVITSSGERVEMWDAEAYLLEEPGSSKELETLELYAWVGRDEMGSGAIGLKQALVPAGVIPMVSLSREKLEAYWDQAERMASIYGKRVFLIRFQAVEVVRKAEAGSAE